MKLLVILVVCALIVAIVGICWLKQVRKARRRKKAERLKADETKAFRKEIGVGDLEAMKLNLKLLVGRVEELAKSTAFFTMNRATRHSSDYEAERLKKEEEAILKEAAKIEVFYGKQEAEKPTAKLKKMRAELEGIRAKVGASRIKRITAGIISGSAIKEFKEMGILPPKTRLATVEDYRKWLGGFVANGGVPTHFYDYPIGRSLDDWLVVEADFELLPLYGSRSLNIIVAKEAKFKGGNSGHTELYFMDGFTTNGSVPFYSDTKNLEFPGIGRQEAIELKAKLLMMVVEALIKDRAFHLEHLQPIKSEGIKEYMIERAEKEVAEINEKIDKKLAEIESLYKEMEAGEQKAKNLKAKLGRMRVTERGTRAMIEKEIKRSRENTFRARAEREMEKSREMKLKVQELLRGKSRSARVEDYKKWLAGFIKKGGEPTHFYDYPMKGSLDDWLVATADFELVPLYGANSLHIIVLNGVKFKGGDLGHTELYFMDGFEKRASCIPVYADIEF